MGRSSDGNEGRIVRARSGDCSDMTAGKAYHGSSNVITFHFIKSGTSLADAQTLS